LISKKQDSINKLYELVSAANSKKVKCSKKISEQKIKKIISPSFFDIHEDIKAGLHTYYKIDGGRGSLKSSFVSEEIINGIMRDAYNGKVTNALILRRYKENLTGSVYEQLIWAIDKLEVSDLWHSSLSPLALTYLPTGQKVIFRGADKPTKIKSIKIAKGYIKYLWFEELDEFEGKEKIRSIQQSMLRGGNEFTVFYSYNPPRSQRSWVNDPVNFSSQDILCHHSTYLTAPPDWLGKQFIAAAEDLKISNYDAYRHEYLGEITGTGAEVFINLKNRKLTDVEIKEFDRIRRGLDFGFASDPLHYAESHFDKTRKRLYIFFEIHATRMSNFKLTQFIRAENKANKEIIADSAEPKSISEMNGYGLHVRGAKKGPDSVDYGIKWMQDLNEIIIDAERCPNTWREFYGYELERDANGNLKAEYPDKNNHSIDAVRYSLNDDIKNVRVV
jgi:phage terminase large subunit